MGKTEKTKAEDERSKREQLWEKLSPELKKLDKEISDAYETNQKGEVAFLLLLIKGLKRDLPEKIGYTGIVPYLMDRLGCGVRTAYYVTEIVEAFSKSQLDSEHLIKLGATRAREISIFIKKTDFKEKKAYEVLIASVLEQKMTANAIQQLVQKRLDERGVARRGRGKDPNQEPRSRRSYEASDSQQDSIQESIEAVSKIVGSKDPATVIEYSLANLRAEVVDDPGDAVSAAEKHFMESVKFLNQALDSATKLSDSDKPQESKIADAVFVGIAQVALSYAVSAGGYLTPNTDLDGSDLADALGGSPSKNMQLWRGKAANTVAVLCRAFGVDKKLVAKVYEEMSEGDKEA